MKPDEQPVHVLRNRALSETMSMPLKTSVTTSRTLLIASISEAAAVRRDPVQPEPLTMIKNKIVCALTSVLLSQQVKVRRFAKKSDH
jgi:hypothetical protein